MTKKLFRSECYYFLLASLNIELLIMNICIAWFDHVYKNHDIETVQK